MTSDNPAYRQPETRGELLQAALEDIATIIDSCDGQPVETTVGVDMALLANNVLKLAGVDPATTWQLATSITDEPDTRSDRANAVTAALAKATPVVGLVPAAEVAQLRAELAGYRFAYENRPEIEKWLTATDTRLDEILTTVRALSANLSVPASQPTTEDSSAGSGELRAESEATGDDATEAITAHDLDIGADSDGQAELRCPAAHCSRHWTDLDNGTTIRELIRLADEHIASHHTPADSSGEATA